MNKQAVKRVIDSVKMVPCASANPCASSATHAEAVMHAANLSHGIEVLASTVENPKHGSPSLARNLIRAMEQREQDTYGYFQFGGCRVEMKAGRLRVKEKDDRGEWVLVADEDYSGDDVVVAPVQLIEAVTFYGRQSLARFAGDGDTGRLDRIEQARRDAEEPAGWRKALGRVWKRL